MADPIIREELRNLARVQRAMRRAMEAMQPSGDAQAAVQFATLRLHRYMTSIVHVDTGRLKNSLFPKIDGLRGMIFTNVNYAAYEENRPGGKPGKGGHAFMRRTMSEDGPAATETTLRLFQTKITQAWNSED